MELQKASVWKRISAWLFDNILLVVLAASVISLRLSSDARASRVVASEVSKASVVRAQVLQRAPIRAR